ncbi:FtsL-like putative cell division protein [Persicitalea sp.]|uniref:FtsL-like putative cell division protein n=1 Tax=Persicitalea sp. TaxID=3100273 RepID=UPI0035935AB5
MNQRRTPPPPPKPKREFSLFNWLNRFLPLERIFGEKDERHQDRVPIRYFYYFLWVVFLLVAYERVGYLSEQYVIRSLKLKTEVEDLRAEYTATKAAYMKSGKQSEIVERVKAMGLEENLTPPKKIVSLSEERE